MCVVNKLHSVSSNFTLAQIWFMVRFSFILVSAYIFIPFLMANVKIEIFVDAIDVIVALRCFKEVEMEDYILNTDFLILAEKC